MHESQIEKDIEQMAVRHKRLSFVFYNDQGVLRLEIRRRLERLQQQLGHPRIVITDASAGEVFARPWTGEWIHIGKGGTGETIRQLTPAVSLTKKILRFRYLGDETGLVPAALLLVESGIRDFQGRVMDLSLMSEQIRNAVQDYVRNLVFARAA